MELRARRQRSREEQKDAKTRFGAGKLVRFSNSERKQKYLF
jgi:hypothetical protein